MNNDPTAKAILYVPSGKRPGFAEPLSDTFYRNCIASGAIVPPPASFTPGGVWIGLWISVCMGAAIAAIAWGLWGR